MMVIIAYSVNHIIDDIRDERRIVKLFANQERFRQVPYRKRIIKRKKMKQLKRRRIKMIVEKENKDDSREGE